MPVATLNLDESADARSSRRMWRLSTAERSLVLNQLRRRFWIELGLAVANIALLALTLIWDEWIELVFQVDPDAGSGALEWAIVGITLALSLTFVVLARLEWRRTAVQIA
jgi:hypothetical protein